MPRDRKSGREASRSAKRMIARCAAGVCVLTLVSALGTAALGVATASAQEQSTYGSDNEGAWNKFMRTLGVKGAPDATSDIDYTERAPLVVPPSRDLPPPAANAGPPSQDWPNDPAKRPKQTKGKPGIVPATAVATPNPPYEKKPWYNPAGWFSREEYATFAGEPVRQNLTDPPAGYRIPSPDHPYGISPDKKAYKPTGKDMMATPIAGGQ
jgi:hypothetical protein